jgi:hypothetical protein
MDVAVFAQVARLLPRVKDLAQHGHAAGDIAILVNSRGVRWTARTVTAGAPHEQFLMTVICTSRPRFAASFGRLKFGRALGAELFQRFHLVVFVASEMSAFS